MLKVSPCWTREGGVQHSSLAVVNWFPWRLWRARVGHSGWMADLSFCSQVKVPSLVGCKAYRHANKAINSCSRVWDVGVKKALEPSHPCTTMHHKGHLQHYSATELSRTTVGVGVGIWRLSGYEGCHEVTPRKLGLQLLPVYDEQINNWIKQLPRQGQSLNSTKWFTKDNLAFPQTQNASKKGPDSNRQASSRSIAQQQTWSNPQNKTQWIGQTP